MKKLPKHLEPISREVVERIAHIIGGNLAAAAALADLDRRLAAGENAAIFLANQSFIVGPAPAGTTTISLD